MGIYIYVYLGGDIFRFELQNNVLKHHIYVINVPNIHDKLYKSPGSTKAMLTMIFYRQKYFPISLWIPTKEIKFKIFTISRSLFKVFGCARERAAFQGDFCVHTVYLLLHIRRTVCSEIILGSLEVKTLNCYFKESVHILL